MNPDRPPRLPFTFSPCQISSVRRRDGSLIVSFTFPPGCEDAEPWALGITDAAQVLAGLFHSFSRHVSAARRAANSDAQARTWRARLRAVQAQYHRNRRTMKHRAAIRALLLDPKFAELVDRYHWGQADFASTVKAHLGPVSTEKGGSV